MLQAILLSICGKTTYQLNIHNATPRRFIMVLQTDLGRDDHSKISLPSPLLEDILDRSDEVYSDVVHYSKLLKKVQNEGRELLLKRNNIRNANGIEVIPMDNISGVDGAYVINKSVTADIYIIASLLLADEEIVPRTRVYSLPPSTHSTRIAQGIMSMLEIENMSDSTNDLVLYDGSFVTPLIKLNSLYTDYNTNISDFKLTIRRTQIESYMDSFRHSNVFSEAIRSGKVIAVPKESGSSAFSSHLMKDLKDDSGLRLVDKPLLSGILNPGEYIITNFEYDQLHLPQACDADLQSGSLTFDFGEEIIEALRSLKVMFIKPHAWSPCQRVEFSSSLSSAEIECLANTIITLFISPSVIEPYPLFITDRICKSISESANAITSSTMLKMTSGPDSSFFKDEDLQWMLRPYRTEV